MIEIISTEKQKITDQEVTEALRIIRQYCKEHDTNCQGCWIGIVHSYSIPEDWDLPGDEEEEP